MSYIGENNNFSFRDGCCESLPGKNISTADAAGLGRILSRFFQRFSVGCDSFCHNHILYAICCGISECGKDAYVCENTDLPSFLFGFPVLSADCGIYVSGSENSIKISFFGGNRFPLTVSLMKKIMNASPAQPAAKPGKLTSAGSFREIYLNNIADSLRNTNTAIPAGISCGCRSVRSLWLEFFTGNDDELVFQISDDGRKVNAYSTDAGFISYERLVLAYACSMGNPGDEIYLPDSFHCCAELTSGQNGVNIRRFSPDEEIPPQAAVQRFLYDALYMCTQLAADRKNFLETINSLPGLAAVHREIAVSESSEFPENTSIPAENGRVLVSRSGRNRVTLTAQALTSETAAELCGFWTDKLRKGDI